MEDGTVGVGHWCSSSSSTNWRFRFCELQKCRFLETFDPKKKSDRRKAWGVVWGCFGFFNVKTTSLFPKWLNLLSRILNPLSVSSTCILQCPNKKLFRIGPKAHSQAQCRPSPLTTVNNLPRDLGCKIWVYLGPRVQITPPPQLNQGIGIRLTRLLTPAVVPPF